MKIDRRLVLLGVMLVVLSMTMATQYATTKVSYSYAIVHPSDADIRFIGSDNSSDDGIRVLRVTNNASGSRFVIMELGDWMPLSEKNYTAAFGIVNEEPFAVNISFVNVSGGKYGYISIWLHGNRSTDVTSEAAEAKTCVVNGGNSTSSIGDTVWVLAAGDSDSSTMNASSADITTAWDPTADVRYSETNTYAINGTSDFVWVQVSLDIPSDAADAASATGQIWIHFEASTH